MATGGKADVALFYNEADEDKAEGIRQALEAEHQKVISYSDMIAGVSKLKNRFDFVKESWCVVLIVTKTFADNSLNSYETELAVWEKIERGNPPKVVPVLYCDESKCPDTIRCIVSICGIQRNRPVEFDKIAGEIVKNNKQRGPSSADPVEVEVKEFQLKALKITDDATSALVEHYKMDDKMKELHQNMQDEIGKKGGDVRDPESDTGCSCRQGELWKKEISDDKYWAKLPPDPFRNIAKVKGPDSAAKHTADIHKLYQPGGYLKLASAFLFKRPLTTKPESQCGNIAEYLDQDGILQLLVRCKVFDATDDERASIEKVREVRHRVAHVPHVLPTDEEQQQFVEAVAEGVADALYRLLSRHEFMKIIGQIDQVKSGKMNMTIEPGSSLEREVDQVRRQTQADHQDIQTVLQNLRDLQVGGSSAGSSGGGASN